MSAVELYVISTLLIVGCKSIDLANTSAEQRSRKALIAVADYVAARKGNERYALSAEVYCGYPETCNPGEKTTWDSMTIRPVLARLRATLVSGNLRDALDSHTADAVLAFAWLRGAGDSSTLIVRYENQRGARVDEASLRLVSGQWIVDSVRTVTWADRVDSIMKR